MKRLIQVAISLALLTGAASAQATVITIDAFLNSVSGGSAKSTGINLVAGDLFSITAGPADLWSAGPLPRWSNADGLVADVFATGTDESGESSGTQIGADFGLLNLLGLNAPYGALVGEISGTYFLIGTSFSGPAPASGPLNLFYWDSNNYDNSNSVMATISVPEPATWALFALALASLGAISWRRKSER